MYQPVRKNRVAGKIPSEKYRGLIFVKNNGRDRRREIAVKNIR